MSSKDYLLVAVQHLLKRVSPQLPNHQEPRLYCTEVSAEKLNIARSRSLISGQSQPGLRPSSTRAARIGVGVLNLLLLTQLRPCDGLNQRINASLF